MQEVSLAALEHAGEDCPDRVELAEEVDLPRCGPPGVGCLRAAARRDAGVRAEEVDGAERLLRGRDEPLHLALVAHVAFDADRGAARAVDELGSGACAVAVDVGDRDRCAVGGEAPRERAPDAGGSTGDDDLLPRDLHRGGSVLVPLA